RTSDASSICWTLAHRDSDDVDRQIGIGGYGCLHRRLKLRWIAAGLSDRLDDDWWQGGGGLLSFCARRGHQHPQANPSKTKDTRELHSEPSIQPAAVARRD